MTANQDKQRRKISNKTWDKLPPGHTYPDWDLPVPTEADVKRAEQVGRKLMRKLKQSNPPKMNLRNYNHDWNWSHLEELA